jgi:two-component system KDP operon response regulator KdpE
VLVVDDEPQIRRAMRTSLAAHGYDVRTVGTGEEAVIAAAEDAPELVLLDLGLPDLDGTEVIRRVRSFSEVPIIVLSVRDRQADKVAALDAGADDYVTKPFGVDEVLARLVRRCAGVSRRAVAAGPTFSELGRPRSATGHGGARPSTSESTRCSRRS